MQILVKTKTLSKHHDILTPVPYEIPDETQSLRQLLTALAETEADRYNQKVFQPQLLYILTEEQVASQAEAGKVGFGRVYSSQKADEKRAADHVIQCWQDGLIRVFLDDMELTQLDTPVHFSQNNILTLIRLTFLTGWM